jgi:hypothetical protein
LVLDVFVVQVLEKPDQVVAHVVQVFLAVFRELALDLLKLLFNLFEVLSPEDHL